MLVKGFFLPSRGRIVPESPGEVNRPSRREWSASNRPTRRSALERQALQVRAKGVREIRTRQREVDGGLEEAELLPRVVAPALELHGVDGAPAAQRAQAVGELDLAARVGKCFREDGEEVRGEYVAADDREVRGRVLRIWLLHEIDHLEDVAPETARHDDAVAADLFLGDAHDGEHGTAMTLEGVKELTHARHARHDDVVTEENAERLLPHQRPRAEDGVTEPEGLLLPDVGDGRELGDGLDLGQLLGLAAVLQVVLELEGRIEVILDGALVP